MKHWTVQAFLQPKFQIQQFTEARKNLGFENVRSSLDRNIMWEHGHINSHPWQKQFKAAVI